MGLRVGFMVQALEGEIQARPHVTFVKNLMTGNVGCLKHPTNPFLNSLEMLRALHKIKENLPACYAPFNAARV